MWRIDAQNFEEFDADPCEELLDLIIRHNGSLVSVLTNLEFDVARVYVKGAITAGYTVDVEESGQHPEQDDLLPGEIDRQD